MEWGILGRPLSDADFDGRYSCNRCKVAIGLTLPNFRFGQKRSSNEPGADQGRALAPQTPAPRSRDLTAATINGIAEGGKGDTLLTFTSHST